MDANKAEKLAAAKKKLKQFQQKGVLKGSNASQLHQQSDTSSSLATMQSSEVSPEESSIQADHEYEKKFLDKASECEFIQIIEALTKDKNDLISSNLSYKDLIAGLEFKLEEERKLVKQGKENMIQLQQDILDKKCLREDELKNTISILIEEKNELTSSFTQSQQKLKQLDEEKLHLKAELEKTQASLLFLQSSTVEQTEQLESKLATLSNELCSVSQELTSKNQLHGEINEELEQCKIYNNNQLAELNKKDVTIKELKLQIELLTVNMQQLKNAGPPTVDQSLEKMQRENSKLEEEISDLRDQMRKLGTEKDVLAQQYQQYILRLNGQIRTISSQAELLAIEKRNVDAALESKNDELAELKVEIAVLKKGQETSLMSPSSCIAKDMVSHTETLNHLAHEASISSSEITSLQQKICEMNLNNEELAKLVIDKESRIQELEIRIDRMQSELNIATANQDQREREKLLQAMQSDKSAASRAIAQNRQLKIQLGELEKAFIQLSNDKLTLTEESQTVIRHNKEMREKIHEMEPELAQLRQEVEELTGQRNATIYWKQELEEAHERIQALSHQNTELKKRVIWNLNQTPVRSGRKARHDHVEGDDEKNDRLHTSSESEEQDWVPSEEHQKLLFHYGQLEQQLQRTVTTVTSLTDEKQKLEHLVLQLQSETETIGEYVSLYQVQRGLLRRRAEQLATERQKLKERIEKLTALLPCLAPQLRNLPQWLKLQNETDVEAFTNFGEDLDIKSNSLFFPKQETDQVSHDESLELVATKIVDVLTEISSCSLPTTDAGTIDPFQLDGISHAPHENFHPCQVCSGRLMTV